MTSIQTNSAALAAIATLRTIDSSLSRSQGEISSGLRVQTASDNAAYWSIATTMRSDTAALSAVEDALGLGAAMVDTAYVGMSDAVEVMSDIKARLVAAREPGVDKNKINAELDAMKDHLRSIASSSSFAGENWLHMTALEQDVPKDIVGSFTRSADGTVAVNTIRYDMQSIWDTEQVFFLIDDLSGDSGIVTNSAFADQLGTTGDWVLFNGEHHQSHQEIVIDNDTPASDIDEMISVADAMLQKMIDVTAGLGAIQARIELQTGFTAKLIDTLDRGVGRLVDADLDKSSTRLKALQTQQQLGIQALGIANSSADSVLQLFR